MLTHRPLAMAIVLADAAHRGQVRKYTNEPYVLHAHRVAELVAETGAGASVVAAAYLHDLAEDTVWTIPDLQLVFGDAIARLVNEVTDVSRPHHGDRATRKAMDRAHLACASPAGKTIKLADMIDNTSSIVEHDPKFARIYMAEKRLLLPVLHGGDPRLFSRAFGLVTTYFEKEGA